MKHAPELSSPILVDEKDQNEQVFAFQKLIDLLPGLAWSSYPDGQLEYTNQAWLDFCGKTRQQAAGAGWLLVLHPDDVQPGRQKWAEASQNGVAFEMEQRLRRFDGTYRWFLIQARPLFDTWGKQLRWYAMGTDITDRKCVEAGLRDQVNIFTQAQKIAHIGSWEYDHATTLEKWSDETFRIFGLEPQSLFGQSGALLDFIHPEELESVRQNFQAAVENHTSFYSINRVLLKDGSLRFVEILGETEYDLQALPVRSLGSLQDVTARRQLEMSVGERIKELTCLQNVGRLLENLAIPDSELCRQVIEYLIAAMQYPQIAAVRIELDGKRYQSNQYDDEFATHGLKAVIMINARECGQLLVCYIQNETVLVPEEQTLLDNVARMLGLWFERKKSEAAVRKLSQAVEQSPVSIVISNIDGSIEYVNPRFTGLTGYTQAEALGQNPRILKTGHTTRTEYETLWKTILSGQVWHGEFQNRKKNGEIYWETASISPILDEAGGVTHFVAVKEDITGRKLDQARITEALEFTQTILQTSPIGITIYKTSGPCISANAAAGKIIGIDPESLLEQDFHTLETWKKSGLYDSALRAMNTGLPVFGQIHTINSVGKELWLNTTCAPFNSAGEPHLLLMFEDNSERQKAEELLRLSNEKLESLVVHLEQSRRNSDLLRQMGELLQVCKDVEEAFTVIEQFAVQLFPGASGAVFMASHQISKVESVVTWGASLASKSEFAVEDCWSLRRSQVHMVKFADHGLMCRHMPKAFAGSYLDIPLSISGEILGLLHLEYPPAAEQDEQTQDLARIMAENLSLSLSNIKLRQTLHFQSVRDPLTGTFNRRYMEETLTRELPRANRKKTQVSIIMLDIDHFKTFNDTYGHAAGDLVLTRLGSLLQTQIRGEDVVCRLGGEEFVMILPDANCEIALQRAEAIRAAVTAQNLEYNAHFLGAITVSLGVAVYPLHGSNATEILEKADKALYLAKHNGRNRTNIARE